MNDIIIAVAAAAFTIWALIAASCNDSLSSNQKVKWFALIILIPIIGPIIYWYNMRNKS